MIIPISNIEEYCKHIHAEGNRIVFTNGCFDIIHVGHTTYLAQAKALGDVLIIGVNTDDSVKRLKGPTRPVNNQNDRAEVLLALKSVDITVFFDEDTPKRLIELVKPDILVKGGDYTIPKIVGADFVLENGGEVKVIPFVEGKSTSKIIEKINRL